MFKSDQEPALKQLKEAVTRHYMQGDTRIKQVIIEESPVGESQSNGEIENEIKQLQNSVTGNP